MRVFNKLFLVGAGLIAIQLVSFENSGAEQIWHKGNLHTELLKI